MRRREEAGGGANGNEGEGKNAKSKDIERVERGIRAE